MKPRSTTSRSLDLLRKSGYIAAVVESWIPVANVRRDLWGFGDILATRPGVENLIVQATTRQQIGPHRRKMLAIPELRGWLSTPGNRCEIWGWHKVGERWLCERVEIVQGNCIGVTGQRSRRGKRAKQKEMW